ncbi:MAG TPA: multidrug efflux SMR transporter [Gammaproteobacteria bacterium]|jgi:small multidrug resistance pump|nr:multidrug efflux SMR transporter [Gammaproteobacteria bacterium]|tara:strand:+ start:116 stop:445 length:330 start_codon:yes stop_codon:yes gene_type:complete
MIYFYLALAIVAEVAGTSLLKATEEFTKLLPTTFLVIFYLISFWLMTLALRELPLGVVYAVWSGLGIVLVAIIGVFVYKEMPDLASILGMGLIISGVVVIHLFSKSIQH